MARETLRRWVRVGGFPILYLINGRGWDALKAAAVRIS